MMIIIMNYDDDDDDDDDNDDDLSKISTLPPTAIFGFGFRGIDWSFVQNLRGLLRNLLCINSFGRHEGFQGAIRSIFWVVAKKTTTVKVAKFMGFCDSKWLTRKLLVGILDEEPRHFTSWFLRDYMFVNSTATTVKQTFSPQPNYHMADLKAWKRVDEHIEPRKKKKPSYFPLNPGCLMTGSLCHGLWNNPYFNWVGISSPISPNQPGLMRKLVTLTGKRCLRLPTHVGCPWTADR